MNLQKLIQFKNTVDEWENRHLRLLSVIISFSAGFLLGELLSTLTRH